MPTYANTHSSGSACGIQTTYFYHEARALIKEELHGTDDDVVLFAGTGCTGAIAKLIHLLGLSRDSGAPGGGSGAAGHGAHACSFPRCDRSFPDHAALLLHARTHQDGDRTSLKKKKKPAAPGKDTPTNGVGSSSVPDTATSTGCVDGMNPENGASEAAAPTPGVVVFVGPMEHHSNLLPWREAACTLVEIPADPTGRVDQEALESALTTHASAPLRIGSFSAGSNLTGVIERVDAVTALLHRHGALSLWDYAAAGPHVEVDLNPTGRGEGGAAIDPALLAKDAVFLSPHKFPGGPGTPGVLAVKKRLLRNAVPYSPGGGTVFYVSSGGHRYLENIEEREEGERAAISLHSARADRLAAQWPLAGPPLDLDWCPSLQPHLIRTPLHRHPHPTPPPPRPNAHSAGGTPDVLGVIRAGLVFQLKGAIGATEIRRREGVAMAQVRGALAEHPRVHLLGDPSPPQLPILGFLIEHRDSGRFLHWNFVTTLLSDLFGIQARGGCLCAGPYGHSLLNIPDSAAARLEQLLLHKNELVRPGFVRVSLEYAWSPERIKSVPAPLSPVHPLASSGGCGFDGSFAA